MIDDAIFYLFLISLTLNFTLWVNLVFMSFDLDCACGFM